jgi:hypothetical protein
MLKGVKEGRNTIAGLTKNEIYNKIIKNITKNIIIDK